MAQIAAYAFNEGSGTTAAEVSGGSTITGVPGWGTGRHGSAMELALVNGPTISPFSTNTAFTVMFDVYMMGDGGSGYNIFLSNTAGIGNLQCASDNTFSWYHDTSDSGTVATIPDATWTNVCGTADGTTRKVYIDGTLVATLSVTALSSTGAIKIGGDLGGGYTANFRIDNLRFYNTALSGAEVAALAGTAVGSEPGVVSITDSIGLTDSVSAASDTMYVNLSEAISIQDTENPLTVEVSEGVSDNVDITDLVTSTLTGAGPSNAPPVANAGSDQALAPNTLVTLDGSASYDTDGTVITHTWTQVSGPAVTLAGSGATRTFTPTAAGTYVFGLTVTDNAGAVSSQDTVTVTVDGVAQLLAAAGYVPYIVVAL